MNLTPTAAQSESPKIQYTDGAQAQGLVSGFPRPKSWNYMHRAKWAGSLPVPAAVQRTAICIADHINERTGRWDLSSAQMADETNQCERTIRSHIKMIRPYIHVEDRPGLKWRFTFPAPLMATVEPRQALPGTPASVADVPCDSPSEVHTKGERERLTCEYHGRSWPESWGVDCFECNQARTKRPKRTRHGRSTDRMTERINRARLARIRAERDESVNA